MKKEILPLKLLFVLIISTIIANAQWVAIAPVYNGMLANDGAISFSLDGKGYLIAGSSTKACYEYDTLANTWTPLGNIPASMGQVFGMSFVLNNKAYVIGGDSLNIPLNTVWEFDPVATNHWTQKNNFSGGVRDAGFGFAIGNYGYVGGGFDGTSLYNDIWKYDPTFDSWTQLPVSIPLGLLFPVSFVIGNNGYILTGGTPPNGTNETKKMWCLNGTTGTLTPKADFAGTARQACIAFSNDSYGYVGGGQAGFTTNYSDMWKYDTLLNSWSQAADVPMLGSAWASAFTIGNTAYAGIGAKFITNGLTGNDSFYKYTMDLATGIENNISTAQLNLFPNPAREYIQVSSNTLIEKIKIYDINGRFVDEQLFPSENIYVGNLNSGLYTIVIQDKANVTARKFVKE